MVLTPAEVHNVAFSRPRIGKRGYDEQEVDLFIDLVEQELTRHLNEGGELRSRCAVRTVAAVHGPHDMERMAIRAVTEALGNTVTETVRERARRSPLDQGAPAAGPVPSELDRLRKENAELTQSLRLLKSAAASLAAALDRP